MKNSFIAVFGLSLATVLSAQAEWVYVTQYPWQASEWIYEVPSAADAKCILYKTTDPRMAHEWVHITPEPHPSSKWVAFTNDWTKASPRDCLKNLNKEAQ